MKKQNTNKPRAIFNQYGSKFFHRLLDLEKHLQKTTELTRPKLLFILICCLLCSGMCVSLFGPAPFSPIYWVLCGLFSFAGLLMTAILFVIVVIAVYAVCKYNAMNQDAFDEERNLTKSAAGTHGTASFLEGDEIKEVYGLHPENDIDSINGFVIGKVPNTAQNMGYIGDIVTRDEDIMRRYNLSNRNTVILGAPGTGKSASIMIPNLIESAKRGESVFVTDPKGELCDKTYPIFKEYGYDVKVFNLIYPWHSDKWNFMEWLSTLGAEREKWVTTISSMIIKNTSSENSNEFWASTAEKLLQALMTLLLEIATPKARIKDAKLDRYEFELKTFRARRDACDTAEEEKMYNAAIEDVIRQKYQYLSDRLMQLKERISECTSPKEKKRLNNMYYKIQAYRNDEMLLRILDINDPPEDYEPLTIREAKKRILNLGTCVKLLQLKIFLTKEEQAKLRAFNEQTPHFKLERLVYELVFKVPVEKTTYHSLYQVFLLCNPNHSLAYSYWSAFTEWSDNVCTSAKGGLDTRLSAFKQYYIQRMTSENEIDLEKPGREKCAYFCIISDQETSLAYISSLFITIAFATLQAQADANTSKRLHVRNHFYLDEFANIGVLPDYTQKLSTLRSRDIHINMAIQNLPQLLQRYDENRCLEMFGDCDLMLFLGCGNEDKTPEFVSKLMGQMTTSTIVKREKKNILSPIKDFDIGLTKQHSPRSLMFINEIRELKQERLIALIRGQKPMQVDKYMYFHRPDHVWIQETIDKYPKISGHPLPGEETIDLDALLAEPLEPVQHNPAPPREPSQEDIDADTVDKQLRTQYREEEAVELAKELLRQKENWKDKPEEFMALIQGDLPEKSAASVKEADHAPVTDDISDESITRKHPVKPKQRLKMKLSDTTPVDPKDL